MLAPIVKPAVEAPARASAQLRAAWSAAHGRQTLFDSNDRDCAQALVSRVFRPHALEPGARMPLAARMDVLRAGFVGLSCLAYGAEVAILPGPLERFYLLQVPLAGQARLRVGREDVASDASCASLISPHEDLAMRWSGDNEQLIVRFEATAVQRVLALWRGSEQAPCPSFAPRVLLDRQPALLALLLQLLHVAGRAGTHDAPNLALPMAQLHYQLIAELLARVPHDQHDALRTVTPPIAPRCVKQVEDYLIEHCAEPLTPEVLAAFGGVSVRSLYLGFQRYRGTSPMALLRELRLLRVHDELLGAGAGTRVTDVALRWGFTHLGRFSEEYRRRFGETPRQTLLACRQA